MSTPRRRIALPQSGGGVVLQSDGNVSAYVLSSDRRAQQHDVIERIPISKIDPSPWQHRSSWDEEELRALGQSFGDDGSGLLQPPTVRRLPNGRFELVAGERRVRAAQLVGHQDIQVVVRDLDDVGARVATAVENVARSELRAWELAQALLDLRQVARETGRKNAGAGTVAAQTRYGRSVVSEYLRVAEAISRDMLLQSGAATADGAALDPAVLEALTLDELLRVAKEPKVTRVEHLAAAVRRIRAAVPETVRSPDSSAVARRPAGRKGADTKAAKAAGPAVGSSSDRAPSFDDVMAHGNFRKRFRKPVSSMTPGEAASHLDDLLPAVAALACRVVSDGHGPAVHVGKLGQGRIALLAVGAGEDELRSTAFDGLERFLGQ